MSIDVKAVRTWTAAQMFREFAQRQDLLGQLVGSLYTGIVSDEMAVIEAECLERFNCAPVWLIDKNIITASRTDDAGVVHDVIKPCDVHYRGMRMSAKLDIPAKPLSCLLCLVG